MDTASDVIFKKVALVGKFVFKFDSFQIHAFFFRVPLMQAWSVTYLSLHAVHTRLKTYTVLLCIWTTRSPSFTLGAAARVNFGS